MNKGTIITLVLSIIAFSAIGFLVTIFITPQADPGIYTKTEYEPISKNEYVFIPSKDISKDGVEQKYEVNRELLNTMEKTQGYRPRKQDLNPFSSGVATNSGSNANTGSSTNQTPNNNNNQNSSSDSAGNNPSSPNAQTNAQAGTGK